MSDRPLTCRELVELVTEYLEGGLGTGDRKRFEEHVSGCEGCSDYLDQIRTTIAITGRLNADHLGDETKTELLAAFRDWKRA